MAFKSPILLLCLFLMTSPLAHVGASVGTTPYRKYMDVVLGGAQAVAEEIYSYDEECLEEGFACEKNEECCTGFCSKIQGDSTNKECIVRDDGGDDGESTVEPESSLPECEGVVVPGAYVGPCTHTSSKKIMFMNSKGQLLETAPLTAVAEEIYSYDEECLEEGFACEKNEECCTGFCSKIQGDSTNKECIVRDDGGDDGEGPMSTVEPDFAEGTEPAAESSLPDCEGAVVPGAYVGPCTHTSSKKIMFMNSKGQLVELESLSSSNSSKAKSTSFNLGSVLTSPLALIAMLALVMFAVIKKVRSRQSSYLPISSSDEFTDQ